MTRSYWRERAAPIIARIINENPKDSDKEVKRKISKAYPFCERKYHPYKIWLSEVKRQMECRHDKLIPQSNQELIDELPLFNQEIKEV